MPFSFDTKEKLEFLDALDADQYSISRDDKGLVQINKRSSFSSFFWTLLHYVSFGTIPRNRKLDCITREILDEIRDELEDATKMEKDLADNAVRKLQTILDNNGGSEGAALEELLKTIEKIKGLPEVQKLTGSDTPEKLSQPKKASKYHWLDSEESEDNENPVQKEVEEPKLRAAHDHIPGTQSDDTKLQKVLQDLVQRYQDLSKKIFPEERKSERQAEERQFEREAKAEVCQILPEITGTISLSDDELFILGEVFQETEAEFLIQNLSPGLLTSIVTNTFLNANLGCLNGLLVTISKEDPSFDKEQALAFASSFQVVLDRFKLRSGFKEIDGEQIKSFMIAMLSSEDYLLAALKTHLSSDELKKFGLNLAELLLCQVQENSEAMDQPFTTALTLLRKLKPEYQEALLQVLSQVKEAKLLAKIVSNTTKSNLVAETIFENNLALNDDSDDIFLKNSLTRSKNLNTNK